MEYEEMKIQTAGTDASADPRFTIIGCEDEDKEAIARPTITYAQEAWRRLHEMMQKAAAILMALAGLMLTLLMLLFPGSGDISEKHA